MANTLKHSHKFGTFSGVFVPSILTIFGPIMFLRFNYVIGNAGVWNTLLILVIAQSISFSTAFSLSAISTNTKVHEGGAYFLISRTLGSGFGGAIGITLYFAQALSVPFYIIGFNEALVGTFPILMPYYLHLSLITGIILFYLTWKGAKWAIKTQVLIFVILMLSILSFLWGAGLKFNPEILRANSLPHNGSEVFIMFAIFFPSVTGIMAGVNMSGDLKNPGHSIALGTFSAVIFATLIYGVEIILCGSAFSRVQMINSPYRILINNAVFGLGFLVVAGVFAATISSAIGSYLGAPRILRALSRDSIIPGLRLFSRERRNSEPKKALLLTTLLTIFVLVWAGFNVGKDPSSDPLNIVAQVVTMFFLYTYGMINLAAFVESFGGNPSFRPRFKYFHWSISLFGLLMAAGISFMIDIKSAIAALIFFSVIFWVAKKRDMKQRFGDARRGFIYSRIRNLLINLEKMPFKAKNWRPTIAVLTGSLLESKERLDMLKFAVFFEGRKGIISVVEILEGNFEELLETRKERLNEVNKFLKGKEIISAFPEVLISKDFDSGLASFLQTHSIGSIKPNIVMMGIPRFEDRRVPFVKHLRMIDKLGKSFIIFKAHCKRLVPEQPDGQFIDIWWRGRQNGSLMFILAYLLQRNNLWKNLSIRVIRTIQDESERAKAEEDLLKMVQSSRIEAETKVIYSENYKESLYKYSSESAAVFLGAYVPEEELADIFFDYIESVSKNMPPIFFVYSSGDADLLA